MNECKGCGSKTSNPKFCSRSCSASYNNRGIRRHGKEQNTGVCKCCGVTIHYRQKFCSNRCQGQFKKDMYRVLIENDQRVIWRNVRNYLIETVGKCQECGISEWNGKLLSLECDHIDGDKSNNRLSNAKLLCPNCHSQTPTYRIKNRDNPLGKHIRNKRYDN